MEQKRRKTILAGLYWGLAFLVVGIFFTLFTFGQLQPYEQQLIWATTLVLGVLGLFFLAYTVWRPQRWWYLIPGFLLLSMAAVVYLGTQEGVGGALLAAIVFLGLALAHLFIFLTNRHERWWAWISSGSFFVLIAALLWGNSFSPPVLGTLLFLGMSLVFLLMYFFLPRTMQRWWTLLLGATFVIAAAFVFSVSVGARSLVGQVWPLLLIALGVALITWSVVRALSRPGRPQASTPTTESAPSVSPAPTGIPDEAVIPVPEDVPERRESVQPSTPEPPEPPTSHPPSSDETPSAEG